MSYWMAAHNAGRKKAIRYGYGATVGYRGQWAEGLALYAWRAGAYAAVYGGSVPYCCRMLWDAD